MHLTPAGFPSGIPGIGEDIDKAMQQAPQEDLQSIIMALRRNGAKVKILIIYFMRPLLSYHSAYAVTPLCRYAIAPLCLFVFFVFLQKQFL
jgi:hypothetical protein